MKYKDIKLTTNRDSSTWKLPVICCETVVWMYQFKHRGWICLNFFSSLSVSVLSLVACLIRNVLFVCRLLKPSLHDKKATVSLPQICERPISGLGKCFTLHQRRPEPVRTSITPFWIGCYSFITHVLISLKSQTFQLKLLWITLFTPSVDALIIIIIILHLRYI